MNTYRPNIRFLDIASHGMESRATAQGWGPQPMPWTAIAIYSAAIMLAAMLLWGG